MSTFLLEIVTPERVAYTDEVNFVSVPSKTGTLGILPRHIHLFTQLIEGEVKIKKNAEEVFLSIGGGYLQVTSQKVIILVTRAVHADELNENEILQAKKKAEEALKSKPQGMNLSSAQTLLRQSFIDLKLLRRMKKSSRH